MKYIVKPLTEDLALTFTEYLGNLDFGHAPHWSTCFCRYYHTNCSGEQWQKRTGEENRDEAIEQIKAGIMKGYLAFDDDKCIGWCNANDVRQYARILDDIEYLVKDQKVGCVICYVIHPGFRGQGVARLLLNEAISDFKKQGYEAVLALPVDIKDDPQKLYRGSLNMYKEYSFEEIEKRDNLSIMWLKL